MLNTALRYWTKKGYWVPIFIEFQCEILFVLTTEIEFSFSLVELCSEAVFSPKLLITGGLNGYRLYSFDVSMSSPIGLTNTELIKTLRPGSVCCTVLTRVSSCFQMPAEI